MELPSPSRHIGSRTLVAPFGVASPEGRCAMDGGERFAAGKAGGRGNVVIARRGFSDIPNRVWIHEALTGATATADDSGLVAEWALRFCPADQSRVTLIELLLGLHRAVPDRWLDRFRWEVHSVLGENDLPRQRLQEMASDSEDDTGTSHRSTTTDGEGGREESSSDASS